MSAWKNEYDDAKARYQTHFISNYTVVLNEFGEIAKICNDLTLADFHSDNLHSLAVQREVVQRLLMENPSFQQSPAGLAVGDLVGYADLIVNPD